jgi:hypothetical protein
VVFAHDPELSREAIAELGLQPATDPFAAGRLWQAILLFTNHGYYLASGIDGSISRSVAREGYIYDPWTHIGKSRQDELRSVTYRGISHVI